MALVRKPAAHSSQNTPVRSACSRVSSPSQLPCYGSDNCPHDLAVNSRLNRTASSCLGFALLKRADERQQCRLLGVDRKRTADGRMKRSAPSPEPASASTRILIVRLTPPSVPFASARVFLGGVRENPDILYRH